MIPVVRGLLQLGAIVARLEGVQAAGWLPSQVPLALPAARFIALVDSWLAGGPFPAPLLVGMSFAAADGNGAHGAEMLHTTGLAFFIGQEIALAGFAGETRAQVAKRANRVIDRLITHGPVRDRTSLELADGTTLVIEPDGPRVLRVRSLPA
ncbi:hypothetical protein ACFO0A_09430 [Novosphingobium tardum]|uniref:Uncharacterized protein n=1 Tax=Novosphingobium tardum TaxID=1538021 RepID=A0ABV8RPH7_9SPHN